MINPGDYVQVTACQSRISNICDNCLLSYGYCDLSGLIGRIGQVAPDMSVVFDDGQSATVPGGNLRILSPLELLARES